MSGQRARSLELKGWIPHNGELEGGGCCKDQIGMADYRIKKHSCEWVEQGWN